MRISVADRPRVRAKVWLDGVQVKAAQAADDVAGWVDGYALDEFGSLKIVNGKLVPERWHGQVRIELLPPEADGE
jgi:hypothetical protein